MKNVSQLADSRQKADETFQQTIPVYKKPTPVLRAESSNLQECIDTNLTGKRVKEDNEDDIKNIAKPIFATSDQVNDFMKRFRKYR